MRRKRPLGVLRNAERFSISELAELAGTRYSTAKYYTELGLIPFEQAGEGLQRYYGQDAAKRLKVILAMRNRHTSVADIARRFGGKLPRQTARTHKA